MHSKKGNTESLNDNIRDYDYINPSHYKQGYKEVQYMMIDTFGLENYKMFCYMNAFKYRMRIGNKPDQPLERDFEKIKWYENRAIEITQEIERTCAVELK